jgi:hypothetical protein
MDLFHLRIPDGLQDLAFQFRGEKNESVEAAVGGRRDGACLDVQYSHLRQDSKSALPA